MEIRKKFTQEEKVDLMIFSLITLGLTIILGIFTAICYEKNHDAAIFTNIQALIPMMSVIIVLLYRKKTLRQRFFYYVFLISSVLAICIGITTPFFDYHVCSKILVSLMEICSFVSIVLIFYFSDPEDPYRINIQSSKTKEWLLYSVIFFALLIFLCVGDSALRVISRLDKENYFFSIFSSDKNMMEILVSFLMSPISYLTVFIFFLGEEFGWRRFLQPFLQKRFGMRVGVLLLGFIWGVWHLPLSIYVYSEESWFLQIILQVVSAISVSVFFGYVYLKTKNIWLISWLHFGNNFFTVILSDYMLEETGESVQGLIISSLMYMILFLPFLKSKVFDDVSALNDMFL